MPTAIAFFWHQHQPYYPDDRTGETLMPWVRLHGVKDYYGMARHIQEVPEFRCTINLVPSLLEQLQRYTDRGGSDRHLDVARVPADSLSERDVLFLLDYFFQSNLDSMIRPHERYRELHDLRRFGESASRAAGRFTVHDLRDLQVWHNLSWFHEICFEEDSDLAQFRRKGRDYTEAEKHWLLDKQFAVLRRIIPLHKQLQDGGQVELTTTPFYHPILPLLWDKCSTHEAMPHCPLPQHLDPWPADVHRQLSLGIEYFEKTFGVKPQGLWPSEGSVSHAIVPAVAEQGIRWMATDEEILAASVNGGISRDEHGHVREPERLYRPWRVESDGHALDVVFRDHVLSDLIGFHYQRSDPHHAVDDLLGRVRAIGRAVAARGSDRPALVPIILDGENCWEYYADGGVNFLRALYRRCAEDAELQAVRLGDYLTAHPATDPIERLFAGSWISHNFWVWIGHSEENTAWDLLHEAREFLHEQQRRGADAAKLAAAQRELDIAQGSDWFWWYGDDHYSGQDDVFDAMFRRHLQNVYLLLDATPPEALSAAISAASDHPLYSVPEGPLSINLDGQQGFYKWIHAGRYVSRSERGTMTLVTPGVVRELYFGLGDGKLFLRLDTVDGAANELVDLDRIRVTFREPENHEVLIENLAGSEPTAVLVRNGVPQPNVGVVVVIDQILELAVPLEALGGDRLAFALDCERHDVSVDRAPHEQYVELIVS